MSDEQEQADIDSAAEHQQVLEQRQLREGDPDLFFARNHDEMVARHRAEQAQLKALNWAMDKIFK